MEKPICAKCEFFWPSQLSPRCLRPTEKTFDVVRGWVQEYAQTTCSSERARPILSRMDRCGPSGRYFEQRSAPEPFRPDRSREASDIKPKGDGQ